MSSTVILSCPMIKKELLSIMAEEKVSLPVYFLPAEMHNDMDKMRIFLPGFARNAPSSLRTAG